MTVNRRAACSLLALLALLALLGNTQAFSPAAFGSAKLFNKQGAEVSFYSLTASRQDADVSSAGASRYSQGHERGALLCGGVVPHGEHALFCWRKFF